VPAHCRHPRCCHWSRRFSLQVSWCVSIASSQAFLLTLAEYFSIGHVGSPFHAIYSSIARVDSPCRAVYSSNRRVCSRSCFFLLLLSRISETIILPISSVTPRIMPRTPLQYRHPRGGPSWYRTPKRVTYAVTVDAYDTPEAIAKIQISASGRHLHTIRSPMSDRQRVFLRNAEPLDDVKDRCELRNAAAIGQLEHAVGKQQRQIDDLDIGEHMVCRWRPDADIWILAMASGVSYASTVTAYVTLFGVRYQYGPPLGCRCCKGVLGMMRGVTELMGRMMVSLIRESRRRRKKQDATVGGTRASELTVGAVRGRSAASHG
jgi:hypothetical protein